MKEITYIEFPSGWRPPAYMQLDITDRHLVCRQISNNGNEYNVMVGRISDEDAIYISLADPRARIKNIGRK